MFAKLQTVLLAIAYLALVNAGTAPTTSKVSAAVKDTTVEGVEGFNVNIAAPFKVQDYIVGFKYALGDLKKFPESLFPETLFAKKSFDTAGEGKATFDAEYNVVDNNVAVYGKFESEKYGVTLTADGDLQDQLKFVGFEKEVEVSDKKFMLKGAYDVLKKAFSGSTAMKIEDTDFKLSYDTEEKDPVLSVTHALDAENELAPSIGLKTGKVVYGFNRKWTGGSLKSKFFPGDKLSLEWQDEGSGGVWNTKAEVPVEGGSPKVSFSRDWTY